MKKINILVALLGLFAMVSCSDEDKDPVVGVYTSPVIEKPATGGSYVLTKETAGNPFETFMWTTADFGFHAATAYTLQIDLAENNFATAVSVGSSNTSILTVDVASMNNSLAALGLKADEAATVEARIMATLHESVDTLYSEVISFDVTPYSTEIVYPMIYVPGSHQGWNPAEAPTLFSVKDDGKYEGYVNFADADTEFKFTEGPNWDVNWGDDGADGTLEPGAANLKEAVAGYYKINVDLNEMTYTTMKTDWGLIGSATPGGWDADTDMTYDTDNKVLTLTVDLVAGEIKFRANDDWALNFGDEDKDGKVLEAGGANIAIAEAGNYTIVLDLSKAIYTYSIQKN